MAQVTIEGVLGFDGTYPLDFDEQPLTNWDFHVIKKISGVRAGELTEAAQAGDIDLIIAFAVIALVRAGNDKRRHLEIAEALMNADAGKVLYSEEDEENEDGDAGNPVEPLPTGPGPTSGQDVSGPVSSPNSSGTGAVPSVTTLPLTGTAG